jgi:phospho-N-acetylmuramoyl-pentapeptide-transferase
LLIKLQRARNIGQRIRTDGPKSHSAKVGTPTLGGIVFVLATIISFGSVVFIKFQRHDVYSKEGIFVLTVFLLCSLIGFTDDWISLRKKRSLGLRGWVKILLLITVCIYFFVVGKFYVGLDTTISIPLSTLKYDIGNYYYIIAAIIIVSTTNAVNLTDGLDGLAAGSSSIVLAVFTFIAFFEWSIIETGYAIDIAILCGATIAASAGFLWWNTSPAEIFMGDTGSFGLGGLIAAVALVLKQEILLFVIGGLFVIEALSVILQVIWFKLSKRRLFKMAPLHHHFELKGLPEIKVIIRFWIICMLFSGLGFFIYYVKFID